MDGISGQAPGGEICDRIDVLPIEGAIEAGDEEAYDPEAELHCALCDVDEEDAAHLRSIFKDAERMASDDARIEQAEDDHRAALDLGQGASSSSSSKSEFYMYARPDERMEIFGRNVHLKLGEKNYRACGHI